MSRDLQREQARGLRWTAWATAGLALVWGLALGSRLALAWGAAQGAVLLLLAVYPRWAARSVRLTRSMPDGACEDDAVPVVFALENGSRLPLFAPEVADRFTPDKVPHRRAWIYPLLGGRRRAEARYPGRCFAKRGVYAIGPASVRLTCPLGLFEAARSGLEPGRIVVYPAIEPLAEPPPSGTSRRSLFGGLGLREAGEGDLALGVRDYRPGDPLRRVHWPTAARRGRLAVLEYERHVAREVAVFLDLSRPALRGLGRWSTLEVSIRLAAAVTARHVGLGDAVSLHAEAGEPLLVPSARGPLQLRRVLEVLARAQPRGERPLPDVIREHAPSLRPGQGALVVAAELGLVAELEDALRALRARRCAVTAVLLDPAGFPALHGEPSGPDGSLHEVAARLQDAGATVYTLGAGQRLSEALAAPYAGRPRVRLTREMLA